MKYKIIIILLLTSFYATAQDSLCVSRLKKTFIDIPLDASQQNILNYVSDTSKFSIIKDSISKTYKLSESNTDKRLYDSVYFHTSPVPFQKRKNKKIGLGYHYGITYYFKFDDTSFQKKIDEWYEYYFQTFSYCLPYHSETNYKKYNFTNTTIYSVTPANYAIVSISKSTVNNNLHYVSIVFNNLIDYHPGTPYCKEKHHHNHSESGENVVEMLRYNIPIYLYFPSRTF